jgi:nicotinamide phosphoribosyltransferase
MVIENTDPEFYWLTNYLETYLMRIWYPITIATNSFYCRKTIKKYLDETSDNPDHLAFALHDFGFRGVSSYETAAIGGMAHLTSFMGTDTLAAITAANEFYNNSDTFKMYGFSVSASEHSTATPWGRGDGELKYIENMLNTYPTGVVSMVADSYDTFSFARKVGQFKEKILNREGRVVIRPDSGDPVEVNIELVQILAEEFGFTVNSKGYKVLPTQVRIIQGDGIDREMIERILTAFKSIGFAADNIVFGSGGGLLQKFDRDTQRFAIKCSYALINGEEVNVQKDPKTAKGTKSSKAGQLKLVKTESGYQTVSSVNYTHSEFLAIQDEMETVFFNGEITKRYDFDEVRNTVTSQL